MMREKPNRQELLKLINRIGIFLGGMRCGSTAILDYVRQHPEVCVHEVKDPHFFSSHKNWASGWESYIGGWSHFDPQQHVVAFESSTHYTKFPLYPQTAERMAANCRDMRLIYGVRGPISRVESHLVHNAGKGYLDPTDGKDRAALLKQAINVSNYRLQLGRFERYFPPEKISVVPLNELQSDPQATLEKVFLFLGVDASVKVESIALRPRRFKHDTENVRLTLAEREQVASALRRPTQMFEEQYGIQIWDGD